MLDQSVFTETIHEVAEIIRTSATPLSKEEILSYFKEMELNEQQENMVLEFLLTPHEEEDAEEEEAERLRNRMFYRNLRCFRCILRRSAVFRCIRKRK